MIVNKITQNNLLYFASIIPFMIFLRDVGDIVISRYVFIAISIIILILSDKYTIYSFIAFLTPLCNGISYTYITSIALVIVLFKEGFHIKVDRIASICIVALLLIEFLSFYRGYFSVLDFLRFSGVFLFSFYRIIDHDIRYDNKHILQNYIISLCCAIVIIFMQMTQQYSISDILSLGIRFGDTASVLNVEEGMYLSYNQNGLGFYCLLGIILSFFFLDKNKLFYISTIILFSLIGIMTQSRAFLVTYLFIMLLYFLMSSRNIVATIKNICIFIIFISILFCLIMIVIPIFGESFLSRFQENNITNGRIDIALFYFKNSLDHIDQLILGVGLQHYADKIGFMMSAHNATQEIIITWGIVGLFFVVLLFYSSVVKIKKIHTINKLSYLPLISLLILVQSGQGFLASANILLIFIVYSALWISPMRK